MPSPGDEGRERGPGKRKEELTHKMMRQIGAGEKKEEGSGSQ
jgi:hypothetical protein